MTSVVPASGAQPERAAWIGELAKYQRSSLSDGMRQLIPTVAAYAALWAAMILVVQGGYPYVLALLLAVVAGGLLVRIFIFFHDACHQSFFRSTRANIILGYACGILVFTPYHAWRAQHLRHHATAGDLDRRGAGDVWTMTVQEYQAAPRLTRIAYRLFRHPLVMFGLGSTASFLIFQRIPARGLRKVEQLSVHGTTLAIAAIVVAASLTIGLRTYIAVQLPIIVVAATVGVWLFYVQHQFKGVYWARHGQWNPIRAALEGASYYRLPRVLRWFSGNIGYHHIHHLRPRIPNYNLRRCYEALTALQQTVPLTLRKSLGSLRLALWDETRGKLVSFGEAAAQQH